MNVLVDENMPRSLVTEIAALGVAVQDVRDIGLSGEPDSAIFDAATSMDAIIITRDRGFTIGANWPAAFTAGVVFVSLPDGYTASQINTTVIRLLSRRKPESLLGAITVVEHSRALSRRVRQRR